MGKTLKRLAIGTALAAAAGYITGLLTAPKSGKETRQDIKENVSKGLSEAEKELKKLHTELADILTQAKDSGEKLSGPARKDLATLVDKAKDTKEKAREMLSAIHEGDADDQDLQKAIKEANVAIDHIKTYLKK